MSGSNLSLIGISLVLWVCWSLLFTRADSQVTHPDEVKALRAIKKSLVDTNGNLSNWRRGDPCMSNWTGVLCYNETNTDGYLHVRELDVMWNAISGTIPKEIGNIKTLELLLLNGNKLTGSLPEELGYLPILNRIQIDQNHISGPLPVSFANLDKTEHFHMNNNSISGQIPPELSKLPKLLHLLLDNNNLSGYLPPELAQIPNLRILQLDNNNFEGSQIPDSYGNMSRLLKLDLSLNQLSGSIPSDKLSDNMTTIDLSYNNLNGTIPSNFSSLPHLQKVTSVVKMYLLQYCRDLRNNMLLNISGTLVVPQNVTVSLQGNPFCSNSIVIFCGHYNGDASGTVQLANNTDCPPLACPPPYEYAMPYPTCFCALPLLVGYRLKSPGFRDFRSYVDKFEWYITFGIKLNRSQLHLNTFTLEAGPRVRMYLRIFPIYVDNSSSHLFNKSEVLRLRSMFTGWLIPDNDLFGPYELLNFTLIADYREFIPPPSSSGISKGALAGIILGVIAGAVTISAFVSLVILRLHMKKHHRASSKRSLCEYTTVTDLEVVSKISVKIDGVKEFNFEELTLATKNFNDSSLVGQGGYGKVYKGTLADGTAVAIKRAQEGSLQGQKEFLTEIELLSRLHHRNLVSLLGYCGEDGEQMLVYEFMPNGTLRDHLSGKCKEPLSFAMRLRVALGSAKGILYLHTEADPPIFHRDIKASNILLDYKFIAKVADFGLSRLAPVPDLEGTLPAHVSTVVKGTPGYLDPEYFLTHKLTDKSDVYSLGVVFLELLTGMQPISHGKNIVREVNLAYRSGMIFNVIDDRMGSYPSECVEKFLNLALKCCQEETDARPSMAEGVRELENIRLMMPESDSIIRDSLVTDSEKDSSTPSSTSAMKYPYVSEDVSGSELVSGVVPSIHPR
ncbi:hypothetical protein RND71_009764 [Anisodus tanguticus]|uniref:non-specific serine/threonine protein kinase n=1 Tax=Anisodus tanguticus TaxID=243964 RepID=A0AAE1SGE1_9SOLA|nr:hypothetical protein RND71_009764 [Anisodus tanguticus]